MFVCVQNPNTIMSYIYSHLSVELLFWLVFVCNYNRNLEVCRQKPQFVCNRSVIICSVRYRKKNKIKHFYLLWDSAMKYKRESGKFKTNEHVNGTQIWKSRCEVPSSHLYLHCKYIQPQYISTTTQTRLKGFSPRSRE